MEAFQRQLISKKNPSDMRQRGETNSVIKRFGQEPDTDESQAADRLLSR